jgi:hypothetical protein
MQTSFAISVLAIVMGIALSAVAAYFSVLGIAAIFAGAFVSVAVMMALLEMSKLVAASWIYRNWSIAPTIMRFYMIVAVIVLVLITSLGIFGYLTKAHVDQTISSGDNILRIEQIDSRIERQQRVIDDAENVITQLDDAVSILQEYDRIRGPNGALAVRESQREERSLLNGQIDEASDVILDLKQQRAELSRTQLELEAKVGPLRYIAEMIYGDEAKNHFDSAVRLITIILVFVFDPLAVCLLLSGNTGLMHRKRNMVFLTEKDVYQVQEQPESGSKEGHGLNG